MDFTHKDLFPLDSSDIYGTILIALGLMIAASGGIGGGGIVVPLLILVYGFQPKHAIALSNFTILGSSLTNMVLNVVKVHPSANRPLVDWDLILVMEPLTMIGAVVGAIVGKILPDWILTLALVTLLAHTTYTTLEKAKSQYEKETKQFSAAAGAPKISLLTQIILEDEEEDEKESLLPEEEPIFYPSESPHQLHALEAPKSIGSPSNLTDDFENDKTMLTPKSKAQPIVEMTSLKSQNDSPNQAFESEDTEQTDLFEKEMPVRSNFLDEPSRMRQLNSLLKEESKTPMDHVYVMTSMVVVVVGLNLLKGGSRFPSILHIRCGSFSYWFLTAVIIGVVLAVSLWARSKLIGKWSLKKRLRYRYLEGDVEWNPYNTIIYPSICFFAGFFAGMFGIGGGIIKGPLMLQMGVHPLVASATVAVMIMFTSVSATAMFVAFGTLTWDYAWFLFVVGLFSTIIGQFGVSYLVDKYKRYSYISISIGAVVAISTLLMGMQSIFELTDPNKETGVEGTTLC